MADDSTKAQIQLGADTTQLEAGVARAKKSLADLGAAAAAAGKQANAGLGADSGGALSAKTFSDAASGLVQAGHGMEEFSFKTAAAKRELLVLAHELSQGNYSRFGSSLLVLGERTGAAALLFSAMGVAVIGTTAAVAGLALAAASGAHEMKAYSDALILSGNAAGATTSQLQAMAVAISKATGATQHDAADAIAQFAQTGAVAAQNLEGVAQAAVVFERATGTAVKNTVQQFVELGKAPLDATIKLNDAFHYLSVSTYEQIRALEQAGKTTEAATLAQRAYADAIQGRGGQILSNLGSIERAWLAIKDATKGAVDAALNVGRVNTTAQALAAAQAELNAKPRDSRFVDQSVSPRRKQELQDEIALLSKRLLIEDDVATSAKAASDQVQARVRFYKQADEFLTNEEKKTREIEKARENIREGVIDEAAGRQLIADIEKKYLDKGAIKTGLAIDRAQLRADLEAYKAASEQFVNTTQNQQRVLEAQHAAGLIGDAEFYRQKRDLLVEQNTVAEYYLQREIARAQKEQSTLSGKDAIDNQTRIIDLRKSLVDLQANSATSLAVLAAQQQASAAKLAVSFLAARQSAQEFFDLLQRQQGRDLNFGQGNATRDFNAGVNQIADRFDDQRRRLDDQRDRQKLDQNGTLTDEQQRFYDNELGIIKEFQQKSIASFTDYYAKREKQDQDASLGIQEAVKNYLEEISKTGKATEGAVSESLRSLEDELTNLLTGKGFDAKRLVDKIIAEFLRLKVIQPIMQDALGGNGGSGWLGSILKLFGGGSGFATNTTGTSLPTAGGAATGTNFVERDMLTILHQGEAVIPKPYNPNAGGSGGDVVIHATYNIGSNVSRAEVVQAVASGNEQLRGDIMRQRSRGTGGWR